MKSKSTSKSQKTTNSNHSGRDKNKINHTQSNNNIDDELGETDSDDTISSTTDSGTVSESDSGKSSPPSSFPDPPIHHPIQTNNSNTNISTAAAEQLSKNLQNEQQKSIISSSNSIIDTNDITSLYTNSNNDKVNNSILKDSGSLTDTSSKLPPID